MRPPRDLARRLAKLERTELDPQRIGAALWHAQETGELPPDRALSAAVQPWLEALEAIERVQEGISPEE